MGTSGSVEDGSESVGDRKSDMYNWNEDFEVVFGNIYIFSSFLVINFDLLKIDTFFRTFFDDPSSSKKYSTMPSFLKLTCVGGMSQFYLSVNWPSLS
jgi:hypothetical protein